MNSSTSTATPTITETDYYIQDGHQLPFRFCAIPHTVIDDEYFAKDPLAYLILSKVARFIALDKHQVVKGQRLKSGWSIPINQKSLATGCNVGRETLNRKLKSLESEGYIQSRQHGRNKVYRLTAYVVSGAQVLEMQENVPDAKMAVSGRADCRDSHVDYDGQGDDQMTVPELVGFTDGKVEKSDSEITGTPTKNSTCDPQITQPVISESHLLIDNTLKDTSSTTSNRTSDLEITPATSDPELDQAKQQSLDNFASAKREINQSVPPAVRKRIKTKDLDRFSAELCDSYGTVTPVQAMEILQRCTKIKKLPTNCPQNNKPIGSPIWFLGVGHDNYLLPVLAEMGLAELPPVQEKSQVEPPKPTSKYELEAGGQGKLLRGNELYGFKDDNPTTQTKMTMDRMNRKIRSKMRRGRDDDQIIKTHTPEPELGPIFCQDSGFDGKLTGNLEPKTGPKAESTDQSAEEMTSDRSNTSQKLDDNEAITDV